MKRYAFIPEAVREETAIGIRIMLEEAPAGEWVKADYALLLEKALELVCNWGADHKTLCQVKGMTFGQAKTICPQIVTRNPDYSCRECVKEYFINKAGGPNDR